MHSIVMRKFGLLQFNLLVSFPAVAFVGGTLFLLQQFAGVNGVLYFSSLTFREVGISSAALASLYTGLTNFAGFYRHVICDEFVLCEA